MDVIGKLIISSGVLSARALECLTLAVNDLNLMVVVGDGTNGIFKVCRRSPDETSHAIRGTRAACCEAAGSKAIPSADTEAYKRSRIHSEVSAPGIEKPLVC